MTYRRLFSVQRGSVNEETGEFRATLFTDGEASDGHILNIAGGRIPDQMPLFVNHYADPQSQLGSLFIDRVTAHTVQVRGQIMVDGEGAEADIRRDILRKMAAGHVSRMSGRWDAEAENVKRRVDLPADHPAHVSDKSRGRKRYGMYFDKWVAQEGSIVGLGADPQATMRWAEEAESEAVSAFWRSHAEEDEMIEEAPAVEELDEPTESEREDAPEEPSVEEPEAPAPLAAEPPSREARLAALAAQIRELQAEGVSADDIASVIEPPAPEPTLEELYRQVSTLAQQVSALQGRVSGEPSPPLNPADLVNAIRKGMDEERKHVMAAVDGFIRKRQGRVSELKRLEREAIDETVAAIRAKYGHIPEIPESEPEVDPAIGKELAERLNELVESRVLGGKRLRA